MILKLGDSTSFGQILGSCRQLFPLGLAILSCSTQSNWEKEVWQKPNPVMLHVAAWPVGPVHGKHPAVGKH